MNAASAPRSITSWAVIGMALVLFCIPASARLPQPLQKRGVIEMIDHNTHTLRLRVESDRSPLTLVWTPRTRIFEDIRTAKPEDLAQGASVTVWHRNPLFGKRFATKILIEVGLTHPTQRGQLRTTFAKP